MGKLEDLQYLLYFRTVQQRVKDAWTFPGGSNDLSADVEFSIGADGTLNGVKIAKSSGDSAFDESVLRAIRRAAPFPPPPDRYRSQFSDVVSTFKLGELKSCNDAEDPRDGAAKRPRTRYSDEGLKCRENMRRLLSSLLPARSFNCLLSLAASRPRKPV